MRKNSTRVLTVNYPRLDSKVISRYFFMLEDEIDKRNKIIAV